MIYQNSQDPYAKDLPATEDQVRESLRELWRKIEDLPGFCEKASDYAADIDGSQILVHDEDGNPHLSIWQNRIGEFALNHMSGCMYGEEGDILKAVADFVTLREIQYYATDAKIEPGRPFFRLNKATCLSLFDDGFGLEVSGVLILCKDGAFSVYCGGHNEKVFIGLSRQTVHELIRGMK